jgi:host factor-I protein
LLHLRFRRYGDFTPGQHWKIVDKKREKNMDKQQQNIQDGFLNSARKEKLLVTVYLLSGVKLTGRIRSFDKYSLILESNHQEQMVFKHAVATVVLPRATPVMAAPGPPEG